MRRRSGLLLVAFLVALAAGCKVDATVSIQVHDDGSGTVSALVELDAEAVRAVETSVVKLEDAVRLGDLEAAGWETEGWERDEEGGGASIEVSKDFERAEDASKVVAELNGPDGPLRDIVVERDVSTFRTQWSFDGVADLDELKTGVGSDPELLQRLVAERVDPAVLDQQLLQRVRDGFTLEVKASLPDAGVRTWRVPPGSVVEMEQSSSQRATNRMILFGLGILVLLVAALVFVFGEGRDLRRRRRQARPRPVRAGSLPFFQDEALADDALADEGLDDDPDDRGPPSR
jgi:hypothetical protein